MLDLIYGVIKYFINFNKDYILHIFTKYFNLMQIFLTKLNYRWYESSFERKSSRFKPHVNKCTTAYLQTNMRF